MVLSLCVIYFLLLLNTYQQKKKEILKLLCSHLDTNFVFFFLNAVQVEKIIKINKVWA